MHYALSHGGGLDSTFLLYTLTSKAVSGEDVITVHHVDYGHLAAEAEKTAIRMQVAHLAAYGYNIRLIEHVLILPEEDTKTSLLFTGNLADSPEIPHRNENIIRKILVDADPQTREDGLYVGAEPVPEGVAPLEDCSEPFFENLRNHGLLVYAPLLKYTYAEYQQALVHAYQNYPELMELSMTCWTPVESTEVVNMHCGHCPHCKKYAKLRREILNAC